MSGRFWLLVGVETQPAACFFGPDPVRAASMKLPKLNNLQIVCYPDPVLKRKCAPVEGFGPELRDLADKMLELIRQAKGVGLAAPQVGIPIRLFVCSPTEEPGDAFVCVNPTFAEIDGADENEEGCLSIPGVLVTMRRATRVVIEGFDFQGQSFRKEAVDLEARIWQHEVDHLNGRLIIDTMSMTDEISNRRVLKQLAADYAATQRR